MRQGKDSGRVEVKHDRVLRKSKLEENDHTRMGRIAEQGGFSRQQLYK